MTDNITRIQMKYVNCYLVKTGENFVLIDTGIAGERKMLEQELSKAGCLPGNLKLVIITHGDTDHSGNGAWLRDTYGAKLVLHPAETLATETGSMTACRGKIPFLARIFLSILKLPKKDRFKADILADEGYDFSAFGFKAKVYHTPGHSRGSITILTEEGALFCGDLLTNRSTPAMTDLIDDLQAANNSVKRLKALKSTIVYPGHGNAFTMDTLINKAN